ncbi:hypothetical protein ACJX0J_031261, partial [Zea mays]
SQEKEQAQAAENGRFSSHKTSRNRELKFIHVWVFELNRSRVACDILSYLVESHHIFYSDKIFANNLILLPTLEFPLIPSFLASLLSLWGVGNWHKCWTHPIPCEWASEALYACVPARDIMSNSNYGNIKIVSTIFGYDLLLPCLVHFILICLNINITCFCLDVLNIFVLVLFMYDNAKLLENIQGTLKDGIFNATNIYTH